MPFTVDWIYLSSCVPILFFLYGLFLLFKRIDDAHTLVPMCLINIGVVWIIGGYISGVVYVAAAITNYALLFRVSPYICSKHIHDKLAVIVALVHFLCELLIMTKFYYIIPASSWVLFEVVVSTLVVLHNHHFDNVQIQPHACCHERANLNYSSVKFCLKTLAYSLLFVVGILFELSNQSRHLTLVLGVFVVVHGYHVIRVLDCETQTTVALEQAKRYTQTEFFELDEHDCASHSALEPNAPDAPPTATV